MKVLIDTCVWSKVLRHKSSDAAMSDKTIELIKNGSVVMIGPIRQELLSGISNGSQFNKLKDTLAAFEDLTLETDHYIKAAEFSNICRKRGVQGSTIDFLICAVANIENIIIFTTDKDFENYKKYLPITLL
ncbi:MAG: PIN domain-containing protein [Nitrospirae bacterium]|nr:PIN domain-containing protein [Nitrospirota bacterium]